MSTQDYRNRPRYEIKQVTAVSKTDDQGIVTFLASVMGVRDYGGDVIANGAYTKTIAERGNGKIKVLDHHNANALSDVVGMVTGIREIGRDQLPPTLLGQYPEATGALEITAQFLMATPEGRGAFERIKAGAVTEYSIGFEVLQEENIVDEATRTRTRVIKEIRLWEVSPVIWGMNPATQTVAVKGQPGPGVGDIAALFRDALYAAIVDTATALVASGRLSSSQATVLVGEMYATVKASSIGAAGEHAAPTKPLDVTPAHDTLGVEEVESDVAVSDGPGREQTSPTLEKQIEAIREQQVKIQKILEG